MKDNTDFEDVENSSSFRRKKEITFVDNVIFHNGLIMQLGTTIYNDEKNLENWIEAINCLEDLMAHYWMKEDGPAIRYKEAIRKLAEFPMKTDKDRIRLAHHKLRALMVLEGEIGMKKMQLRWYDENKQ